MLDKMFKNVQNDYYAVRGYLKRGFTFLNTVQYMRFLNLVFIIRKADSTSGKRYTLLFIHISDIKFYNVSDYFKKTYKKYTRRIV